MQFPFAKISNLGFLFLPPSLLLSQISPKILPLPVYQLIEFEIYPVIDSNIKVEILEKDLRIDTYRSSGAGGQHVNTTDSAVRITHLPSGIVVSQQDEKSQHKNKAKAMKILRARLYEAERDKQLQERAEDRKGQVGSGDRSERIRTYNYPQGRVTDHRINLTLHKLETILEGQDLVGLIEALITEEKARQLSQQN